MLNGDKMDLKMIKVTEKKREAFAQLEIFTVEDLLKHYPLRYEIIDEKPFELWKKGKNLFLEEF